MLMMVWAVCATIGMVVFGTLLFANPYPLFQIPDWGHRLYGVPAEQHAVFVELFRRAGIPPFGTFTAVVRQTLLRDGFTVIASGEHMRKAAISIPTSDPRKAAEDAKAFLAQNGISAGVFDPPETGLKDKLVLLRLPDDLGWDIAFRRSIMPTPKWE